MAGDEADAARRRVKQHHRLGADGKGLAKERAHRHALQHHGRGGLVADGVRQLHQPVGGDEALLGIAAEDAGVRHAVAGLEIGDALPDGDHVARAFHADDGRKRRQRIEPRAIVDVDEIHADGALADQHLAGAGRADLDRLPDQRF